MRPARLRATQLLLSLFIRPSAAHLKGIDFAARHAILCRKYSSLLAQAERRWLAVPDAALVRQRVLGQHPQREAVVVFAEYLRKFMHPPHRIPVQPLQYFSSVTMAAAAHGSIKEHVGTHWNTSALHGCQGGSYSDTWSATLAPGSTANLIYLPSQLVPYLSTPANEQFVFMLEVAMHWGPLGNTETAQRD